jgi:hypothetical protein
MATDEAKEIYKQRAATAETVNADAKAHRRPRQFAGPRADEGDRQCLPLRSDLQHPSTHHPRRVARG